MVRLVQCRPMRLALVILHADASRGGAERYTLDLAAAMAERGHEVSLLASSFGGGPLPDGRGPLGRGSLPSIRLEAGGLTRLGRYVRFLDSLDAHLRENSYDVIHAMLPVRRCDVYHPHAGVEAEALATAHLKYTGAVQRTAARAFNAVNFKRCRFVQLERELLSRSTPPTIICLSDYVRSAVLKHYSLPESKLATIVNGVDLKRFDPDARPSARGEVRSRFSIPPEAVVTLMIAQDFERKGLREAIEATAIVADPRLRLLVVGRDNPAKYGKLARQRGITNRIIFAGATSDPYSFYRAADFFILPTRHDPCSLVVLEALAMGLPVVSTKQNGACEVMGNGREGFIIDDPHDVPALAAAVREVMDDDRRREMAGACRTLRSALSHELHVEKVLRLYEVVLAGRGSSAGPIQSLA